MKRLLFFHNTLPEYRIGFFNALNDKCDLKIIFTDIKENEKIYNAKTRIDRLSNKLYSCLSGKIYKDIKTIKDEIENNIYDVIVLPALDNVRAIFLCYFICYYADKNKIKIIYFWEKWRTKKQPLFRIIKENIQAFLIKPIISKVSVFLVPGIKSKQYFMKLNVSEKNIFKVHDTSICEQKNYFNVKEKYGIPEDKRIILYFGRVVKYKGLDNLIYAYNMTNLEFQKNNYLLIVGTGAELHNCKKLAQKLNLKNIIFTGFVEPDFKYSYFQQCNVFVLPGRVENGKVEAWGLTLNEAIQFDCILISTTSVGSAYELINEKNGFMVEEDNIQALCQALEKTVDNNLIQSAKEANAKLRKIYNFNNMAQDFISYK